LTISNVLGGDAGSYTLVVSNASGMATSTPPAVLTVVDPIITSQPADQTNAAGTTAQFSVGAYGTSPRYQWFKNGVLISGATGATLILTAVSAQDVAGYSVVVSNAYGRTTSRTAQLALVPEPAIESVRFTNGLAVITWSSIAGQSYLLQYKDAMSGTNWQDALPAITATTSTTVATNALSGATQRFYRVILAPVPAPPLAITSIRVAGGSAVITWNSIAGQQYRLQYKNSPLDTTWHDVLPDIIASTPVTTVTNALGGATQRFYRVELLPEVTLPFAITSIRFTNGVALITWNSVAGQTYRLQYKNNLADTVWQAAAPDITATGPTTTLADALGSTTHRFYRVMLVPAVVPPFAITSIRLTNGLAVITWNSVAGQTYRLQYKDRLIDTTWQDVLPDVLATGPITTLTNGLSGATQRFYRLRLM